MRQLARRSCERRSFEQLERERQVLQLLRRAWGLSELASATQLICSAHDASCLYLVMRAYLGGNLANLLAAQGPLTENSARFYLANIALGLESLHVLGVAFRDLKPENVLLGSSGWPVLADFGLVAFVDSSANVSRSYTLVGTPLFMAPEMVAETGHGTEVDWWAMGVLACDCLTGHTPFAEDDDEAALYRNIATATFARRFQREFARRLGPGAPLVDALLKLEPSERLGAGTGGVGALRACPFFRGVPWEALRSRQVAAPHAAWCEDQTAQAVSGARFTPVLPARSAEECARGREARNEAAKAIDLMFDLSAWGEER